MYISGTSTLGAEKVERTIAAVEILTGVSQETISDDELITDKFDSAPDIDY